MEALKASLGMSKGEETRKPAIAAASDAKEEAGTKKKAASKKK
jgi:hypothetical protein